MSRKRKFYPPKEKVIAEGHLPAIPPNDYNGSIACWNITLIHLGLLKDGEFYGDVILTKEQYEEVLIKCEGQSS